MAAVLLLAAGSFVLLTAFHPFIFSIFFLMRTNPGCIYSTACSGQDRGHRKQWCLWPLFWQPPEPKAGNPRGQSVPCWLHWKLQNMFMSNQQELPRLVMPLLSLPLQAAGRSCVKVQAHI